MHLLLPRSIRARILAIFVASLAAFGGALGYGMVQLRVIGADLVAIDAGYLPLANLAAELQAVVRQMDREHDRMARESARPLAGHRSNAEFHSTLLARRIEDGQAAIEDASDLVGDTAEETALRTAGVLLGEIDALRATHDAAFDDWLGAADGAALARVDAARTALILKAGELSAFLEGRIQLLSNRTAQAQTRAYTIGGALAALSFLLAGLMVFVALLTLRPIARLTREVQRLAQGEPWARLPATGDDELSMLNREFNHMAAAVEARDRVRDRLARRERLAVVGQMLAQITHEVRNPLNAMSLNAEMLAEDLQSSDVDLANAQAMMATITAEIGRLEQLTGRYLEMSRGRVPEMAEVVPGALVEEILHVEEAALSRAGLCATVDAQPRQMVNLDVDALRRSLRNLVRNAVEAAATQLHICVNHLPDRVQITVADNGSGMAPEQARQVFEPFFTTKARGTGLGLAISRQELEDVGGSLHCESTLGEGTTFTLDLPCTDISA